MNSVKDVEKKPAVPTHRKRMNISVNIVIL